MGRTIANFSVDEPFKIAKKGWIGDITHITFTLTEESEDAFDNQLSAESNSSRNSSSNDINKTDRSNSSTHSSANNSTANSPSGSITDFTLLQSDNNNNNNNNNTPNNGTDSNDSNNNNNGNTTSAPGLATISPRTSSDDLYHTLTKSIEVKEGKVSISLSVFSSFLRSNYLVYRSLLSSLRFPHI